MSESTTTETIGGTDWESLARGAANEYGNDHEGAVQVLRELLVFGLDGAAYAVPVERVREIVRMRELTTIPRAPGWLLGVVALMEKVRESADQIGEASNEQDRGNEIVYRSALTMREVAQQVRRTTEDQAAGFGRIRENVRGVRGGVEQITGSLGDQAEACERVTAVLDGVADGSRSNEEAARRVSEAMQALVDRAHELRGNVERFRC